MAENIYLARKRAELKKVQDSITAYRTRAEVEKRDLSDDEMRTVGNLKTDAQKLLDEVEELTEIEVQNHRSAEARRKLFDITNSDSDIRSAASRAVSEEDGDFEPLGETEARTGGATTSQRDPGHYRREGKFSYFQDLHRSKAGDRTAARRILENDRHVAEVRALDTTDGTGLLPPKWLQDEYAPLARQGRKLANAVRNINVGQDPRPLILPKQATGADNGPTGAYNVTNPGYHNTNGALGSTTENSANVANADKFSADYETINLATIVGWQAVSRQFLDASSPSVDALIFADMLAAYDAQVEKIVAAAVLAAGPSALAATAGAVTDPSHFSRVAVRAGVAVRSNRKLPASIVAMSFGRYADFIDLVDSTGRPLLPSGSDGPMNVQGLGPINVDGRIRDLGIIATDGITDDDTFAVVRGPSRGA